MFKEYDSVIIEATLCWNRKKKWPNKKTFDLLAHIDNFASNPDNLP